MTVKISRGLRALAMAGAAALLVSSLIAKPARAQVGDPCVEPACKLVAMLVGELSAGSVAITDRVGHVGRVDSRSTWNFQAPIVYGYQTGGQFQEVGRVTIRASIRLEDSWSNWTQVTSALNANNPAIQAVHYWNCADRGGWGSECNNNFGSWPYEENWRFTTFDYQTNRTNFHSDSAPYQYEFYYSWRIESDSRYWVYPMTGRDGPLQSAPFDCRPRSGYDCIFP